MAKKKKNKQPAKKRDRGTKTELNFKRMDTTKENQECENKFLYGMKKKDEFKFEDFENKVENNYLDEIKNNIFNLYKINYKKKKIEEIYTKLFMPSNTLKHLPDELCGDEKIENLALKINKFPYFQLENKDKTGNKDKIKSIYYNKYCFDKEKETVKKINYYNQIKKSIFKTDEFELKLNNKLIIGLGHPSVYETSITLHHIYGVPYIPGSAIKGSFRSYIIEKFFNKKLTQYNNYDKFEQEVLFETPWFVEIFGNQEKQGKVIFFDAFSDDATIKKDIMNPHYPDYYDEKNYPTDDQNPRPINFLTVVGTFKFIFGIKKEIDITIDNNKQSILGFVKENLQKSLQEFGIGAKTSVGYGYFDLI